MSCTTGKFVPFLLTHKDETYKMKTLLLEMKYGYMDTMLKQIKYWTVHE